jgi:hypothetical protein
MRSYDCRGEQKDQRRVVGERKKETQRRSKVIERRETT